MDSQEYENRSSYGHKKFVVMKIDTVLKFWSNLCDKTEQPLGFESRKSFDIAWILTLPATSCSTEHFKDVQETMLLIQSCKTM